MIEENCETFVSDCHVRAAVELISHAWDPVVLSALRLGPTRRSDLLRRIAGVSLRGARHDIADSSAWFSAAHSASCFSGPLANDAPNSVSS